MSSPNASSPSGAMLQAALGGLLCFAACGDPEASTGAGGSPSGGASSGATTGGAVTASGGTGAASPSGAGGSASGSGGQGGGAGGAGEGGAGGAAGATTSGTTVSTSDASSSSTGGNPHTPIPNTACGDGQVDDPEVTSTVVVVLSQDDFLGICAQAGGIFEIQPLCGGSNACRGIAYDSGTHVLTHHTCQATNTCAGYNCVVCDG